MKCVSKSPMEVELVMSLDNINFVENFNEFLLFVLNWIECSKGLSRYNTSVISKVTKGGDNACVHIGIQFWRWFTGENQSGMCSYKQDESQWFYQGSRCVKFWVLSECNSWLQMKQPVGIGIGMNQEWIWWVKGGFWREKLNEGSFLEL